MSRRRANGESGNLDSFLDTLFNVAGILVIIIALTQITAREKVKQINAEEQTTEAVSTGDLAAQQLELQRTERNLRGSRELLDRKRNEAIAAGKEVSANRTKAGAIRDALNLPGEFVPFSDLAAQAKVLSSQVDVAVKAHTNAAHSLEMVVAIQNRSQLQSKLQSMKVQLDANRSRLTDREQLIVQTRKKIDEARLNLAAIEGAKTRNALQAKLRDLEKRERSAREVLSDAELELAKIKTQLAEARLFDGEINVPNPRSAPKGVEALEFWCRNERVVESTEVTALRRRWVEREFDPWLKANRQRIALIVKQGDGKFEVSDVVEYLLKEEWKKPRSAVQRTMRNENFELDFEKFPQFTKVTWRNEGVGESEEDLLKADSVFRQRVRELAREKRRWVSFIVFSDSFKVYRKARGLVDLEPKVGNFKLEAGWEPFRFDTVFGFASGVQRRID